MAEAQLAKILFRAINNNNNQLALSLLKNDVSLDLNACDEDGDTALHLAVRKANVPILKELIAKGAQLDRQNKNGNTPLHLAASEHAFEISKLLIEAGSSLNLQNQKGDTALHFACFTPSNEALIKLLVGNGADFNIRNKVTLSPSDYLVRMYAQPQVDYFKSINSKFSPEKILQKRRLSIVFDNKALNRLLSERDEIDYQESCGGSFVEAVHILLPHLQSFNQENNLDKTQFSPLVEGLDSLLSYPCVSDKSKLNNVMITTGYIGHAFYAFLKKNNDNTFKLIISERGPLNAVYTAEGEYPFYVINNIPPQYKESILKNLKIAYFGSKPLSEEIIFEEIPEIVGQNYQVESVKQKEYKNGYCYYENLKSIICHEFHDVLNGCKGKIKYKEFDLSLLKEELKKYTQLCDDANKQQVVQLCEKLISKKAEQLKQLQNTQNQNDAITFLDKAQINKTDKRGLAPIHYATDAKYPYILGFLQTLGGDINLKTSKKKTPLHLAVAENSPIIVDQILKLHGNINAINDKGQTPLNVAIAHGHINLVFKLLSDGAKVIPAIRPEEYSKKDFELKFQELEQYLHALMQNKTIDEKKNKLLLIRYNQTNSLNIKLDDQKDIEDLLDTLKENRSIKNIKLICHCLTPRILLELANCLKQKNINKLNIESDSINIKDAVSFIKTLGSGKILVKGAKIPGDIYYDLSSNQFEKSGLTQLGFFKSNDEKKIPAIIPAPQVQVGLTRN